MSAAPEEEQLRPTVTRTWAAGSFFSLWLSITCTPFGFVGGAGLLDLGLSLNEAVVCLAVGTLVLLAGLNLSGLPGVTYGIPFPV